ncbi:MAG: hypothetical protein AAFV88_17660 [Planctomycetota bacterium]
MRGSFEAPSNRLRQGDGQLNNRYWQTWVFNAFENPNALRLIERYQMRPSIELYDMESDPFEMKNLASSPVHATIKTALASELDRWLASQADPGMEQDTTESHQAAKSGNHRFRP